MGRILDMAGSRPASDSQWKSRTAACAPVKTSSESTQDASSSGYYLRLTRHCTRESIVASPSRVISPSCSGFCLDPMWPASLSTSAAIGGTARTLSRWEWVAICVRLSLTAGRGACCCPLRDDMSGLTLPWIETWSFHRHRYRSMQRPFCIILEALCLTTMLDLIVDDQVTALDTSGKAALVETRWSAWITQQRPCKYSPTNSLQCKAACQYD